MGHIGSGVVKRWAGWEPTAMPAFIQVMANSPLAAPVGDIGAALATTSATGAADRKRRQEAVTAEQFPSMASSAPEPDGSQPTGLAPVARLCAERQTLHAAQPFTMTMTLDITRAVVATDRLAYNAVIVARQLGGGYRGRSPVQPGYWPRLEHRPYKSRRKASRQVSTGWRLRCASGRRVAAILKRSPRRPRGSSCGPRRLSSAIRRTCRPSRCRFRVAIAARPWARRSRARA